MTTSAYTTAFTTPSPHEIVAVRVFDAPRALVFAAHTEPEHVRRWLLGPDGWSMPVCEIDLRPGGAWRYVWRHDTEGREFGMHGVYREVDAPERIVNTEVFDEPPGAVNTLLLTEDDGRTTMTLTMRYPSEEVRDRALATGMTGGMETSYTRLQAYLDALD